MTRFRSVKDIKPIMGSADDLKPSGEAVLDVKPNMQGLNMQDTIDRRAIELKRGMPMLLWYITYPDTQLIEY